jgi:hypothetical protein
MEQRFKFRNMASIKDQYIATLTELQRLQTFMIEGIPLDALDSGMAMGSKTAATYCDKASKIARKFTNLVDIDAGFTVDDMTARKEFSDFWQETRTLRTEINNNNTLIEGANGRDFMYMAQRVKDNMEVNKNLPKYKADYDDLNLFFTDRADAAKTTLSNKAQITEAKTIIEANKLKA